MRCASALTPKHSFAFLAQEAGWAPVASGGGGRGAAAAPQRTIRLGTETAGPGKCWLQLVVNQRSLTPVALNGPRLEIGRDTAPGRLVIPSTTPTSSSTRW